jgi:Kef-type K+ transport system membrane component KefB
VEAFGAGTATALLTLSVGAFAVPLLCKPLRVPASIGEIAFGVLVGPQVLHLVRESTFVSFLSELGVLLLMFMAGLELEFRALEQAGIRPVVRSLGQVVLVFVVCGAVAQALHWPTFVGLALAATSIGLLVAVLQESGLMKTPAGQHWLLLGSLGEFAAIVVATGVNAHYRAGGLNQQFVLEFSQLGLVFLIAYALLLVLRSAVWWNAEAFGRLVETHDPSEVGVRAGMALMFVFVAITGALHIEPILGSFMAGALFSFVFRHRGALELKFFGLANGFFVPVFFISVGLNFQIGRALQSEPLLFVQMLGTMLLARVLAMLALPRQGSPLRERLAGALLLTCPLTLLVVFADVGVRLELIDRNFQATLVLLAITSSLVFPFIAKALLKNRSTLAPLS